MRSKQVVFLGAFLLLLGHVQAQVTLALQIPPAGVVQKSQLWNMVLVNGNSSTSDVEVNLTLLSTSDNNPVMTASGRIISLAKGARQLKYTDFTPVNYKYLSAAFNVDLRPEGFLPIGSYTACYTVSRWVGDAYEPLAEDCITLEVQPLSPPILNLPADQDTIGIRNPQFSWLPPSPRQLLGDLTYDIIIVKPGIGQTPLAAIQQNIPFYNEGRNRNNFLNYPASAHALDTGVTYAWCVIARNNNQFVAQSDVWTFHVNGYQLNLVQNEGASYIRLQRDAMTATAICQGDILIAYTNEVADTTVHFSIRSLDDGKNGELANGTLTLVHGQNFITLPASVKRRLDEKANYLLEVYNSRNERWGIRFQYLKPATN